MKFKTVFSKYQFVVAALLLAPTVCSCVTTPTPSEPTTLTKPNVLFIAIDDLNDWIGCMEGNPDVKTPALDRLAKQGVLMTKAYCAAPSCNPSRVALLTGIRPSTSGVYYNPQPFRKNLLSKDAATLPQHFMANGYKVMGSGKIFHGGFPDVESWHEYWPSKEKTRPMDPMPPQSKQPLNGIPGSKHRDWGAVDASVEEMGDSQVVDWVSEQLQAKQDKPFFLACGLFRPHLPWYVPEKYFDMYPLDKITLPNIKEDDLDDVPETARYLAKALGDHKEITEHNQWRQAVQGYLASISFVDDCVGRVMVALDKSEYRDNTIVVLWSDHGWHLGEKLHWRKFALWEEATHNVMMFRVPKMTRPNARCNAPVNLIDIYPTLIELCGLENREGLEGASIVPLLKEPDAKWERPALTTYGYNNHTVRSERWRYIRYHDGTEELYDHNNDEMEWENLADKSKFANVKAELAKWLPKVNNEYINLRGEKWKPNKPGKVPNFNTKAPVKR
ncbi:sulfatase [Candidatus Hydrogenedentota bacterium]